MPVAARAFVVLLFATSLAAQTTTISGTVSDTDGGLLPGVTVTISGHAFHPTSSTVTDAAGRFRFDGLPVGEYTLHVELTGFTTYTRRVTASAGASVQVDIKLPVPVTETITVTGSTPPLFTVVRVYYGTNRAMTANRQTRYSYNGAHSSLTFGNATVSIPHDHRLGEWERPLVGFRERQEAHVILLTVIPQRRDEFASALREATSGREALVFVHGYNTSFSEAIQRTALLAYDLEFDGTPIAFTWPSRDGFFRYNADEEAASASIHDLEEFLTIVARESGATRIHLVAHSMGNRVLLEALHALQQRNAAPPNLANLILAAPDVNVVRFHHLLTSVRHLAQRSTLYASNRDKALRFSKWFHDYRRAGQAGRDVIVLSGVETIDVSRVDTSFVAHSYYAENKSVVADLYALITSDAPAAERECLEPHLRNQLTYWVFDCAR